MINTTVLERHRRRWKRRAHGLATSVFTAEARAVSKQGRRGFSTARWEAALLTVWRGSANEWIPKVEAMIGIDKDAVTEAGLLDELVEIVVLKAEAIVEVTEAEWLLLGEGAWDTADVRAVTFSQTESVQSTAWSQHKTAKKKPKLLKIWQAITDDRTRISHLDANGQIRKLNDPFSVGGAALQWPADTGGPLGEIINCRCWEDYILR